jgi:hypothetical protein
MPRDKDLDWERISRTNPYFGVISNQRYANPDAEDLKHFFSTGEGDVRHVLAALGRRSLPIYLL